MNKVLLFGAIVILLIMLWIFAFLFSGGFTGEVVGESVYSYTKAVCDDSNFCQDYEIKCQQGEVIEMNAITGAFVQHDKDWEDPRDENVIEKFC